MTTGYRSDLRVTLTFRSPLRPVVRLPGRNLRPYHPPAQPPPQARKWLDKPNAEVFRIGTQASVPKTPAPVKAASITANAFMRSLTLTLAVIP